MTDYPAHIVARVDEYMREDTTTRELLSRALMETVPKPVDPLVEAWAEVWEGDYGTPKGLDDLREALAKRNLHIAPIPAPTPERDDMQARELHFVFDGPPGPEAGRFVEVETPDGRSVNVGKWQQRSDGYWVLVIPGSAAQPIPIPVEVSEERMMEMALAVWSDWYCTGTGTNLKEIALAGIKRGLAERGEVK